MISLSTAKLLPPTCWKQHSATIRLYNHLGCPIAKVNSSTCYLCMRGYWFVTTAQHTIIQGITNTLKHPTIFSHLHCTWDTAASHSALRYSSSQAHKHPAHHLLDMHLALPKHVVPASFNAPTLRGGCKHLSEPKSLSSAAEDDIWLPSNLQNNQKGWRHTARACAGAPANLCCHIHTTSIKCSSTLDRRLQRQHSKYSRHPASPPTNQAFRQTEGIK